MCSGTAQGPAGQSAALCLVVIGWLTVVRSLVIWAVGMLLGSGE